MLVNLVLVAFLVFAVKCEISDHKTLAEDCASLSRYRRVLWRTGLFVASAASFLAGSLGYKSPWKYGATVWLLFTWAVAWHNFTVEDKV